jgi:beta-lactamase regulating signal transducer with metallopeptidase domain
MIEARIESWVIPASLMIAAVLAIRFVLRGKISLRLQYALWAVVLVRLLVPG